MAGPKLGPSDLKAEALTLFRFFKTVRADAIKAP
jgi:hypothetical protein